MQTDRCHDFAASFEALLGLGAFSPSVDETSNEGVSGACRVDWRDRASVEEAIIIAVGRETAAASPRNDDLFLYVDGTKYPSGQY